MDKRTGRLHHACNAELQGNRDAEIINVTTGAKFFFLKNFSSCDQLSCNLKRSYFTAESDPEIISEAEPETVTPVTTYDVIAGSAGLIP